jgi:uncharacterized protein YkwD
MEAARSRAATAADYRCSIVNPQTQTTSIWSRASLAARSSLLALLWAIAFAFANAATPGGDDYGSRLATLVNRYRVDNGLPALTPDSTLARLALEHSAAMARAERLSHDGFQMRGRRSGYPMCVENVGWNYRSPAAQLDGWRASPGHDRNMLDPRVKRIGIGESEGYVTMLACG